MHALRHLLRRLSWIAFVAVFALAIVPTVSRLLAAGTDGPAWSQICTPQGTKLASAADDGQGSGPAAGAAHLDHCPLCGVAGDAPLPPAAPAVLAQAGPRSLLPHLFLQAPQTLPTWVAAAPRAPPARA